MSAPQPSRSLDVALLQAGALLPAGTALPEGEPAELADGRAYAHPVLGGRRVVRLTARALAAADDTEMEVLGFSPPEVKPGLGLTRPRALGFPGWALVHDPAHARHALAVVKDFKIQAKLARSKPGHARDGFDAIALELSRSVPHFLPSFHEEAGRAFLDAGNRTYAASAFAKAREAERVHALPVDPALRDRAFLEFALAGAVSGKALSEFAQELGDAADPAGAYARFRDLCVRRTLGGMPPWAGMARDLRKLAKRAGVDAEGEDERVVRELLGSPALLHAAGEFWTTYGPALVRLSAGSPAVRATLLRTLPEPPGDRTTFVEGWLDLLARCGVLDAVTAPRDRVAPEARPDDGAAAWLSRLLAHCRGYRTHAPDSVFALIRRMAARLREEQQPVALSDRWGGVDFDVLDLLFELEIPVADPGEHTRLHLDQWIKGEEGSKERPRDPVHAVRDARYRPRIEEALGGAMARPGFDAAARSMRGLVEARRGWILGQLRLLATGTLPAAIAAFDALTAALTARTFAELPEAWEALGKVDLSEVLGRTLRGGLLDELGWPELEAAAAELAAANAGKIAVHGAFPYAILSAGLRAIVVGPKGRVLEHELRLPKGSKLHALTWAQGQLLVEASTPGEGLSAYWSGQPQERFELPYHWVWGQESRSEVELPDGGMVRGGRALHAGDHALADVAPVFGDGETLWVMKEDALRELDPRNGALGRKSLPRFLEEFVAEGTTLELRLCRLQPLPEPARERSPLGVREGLSGLRVRRTAKGALECEAIDGRRVVLSGRRGGEPFGLLRLPGCEEPRLLTASHQEVGLEEPGGLVLASLHPAWSRPPLARGTPVGLSAPFWHHFTVRDEAGSLALRALTAADARRLIDAARQDAAAGKEALPRTREAIGAVAPRIRHDALVAGVAGLAEAAAGLEQRLGVQRTAWDPARAPAEEAAPLDVVALWKVLGPLLERYVQPSEGDLAAELGAVGGFFRESGAGAGGEAAPFWKRALRAVGLEEAGEEQVVKAPAGGGFRWDRFVGATGAVAFVGASPLLEPAQRAAVAAFLRAWAETPFVGTEGRIRRVAVRFPPGSPYSPPPNAPGGTLVARGGRRWFVRPRRSWSNDPHAVLEHSPDGRFGPLPGCTIEAEEPAADDRPWSARGVRRLAERLEREGPPPVSAEAIAELSRRTGLSRPEAALLWTGLPGLSAWEHDFLGKAGREALGLKAAEAKVARDGLQGVDRDVHLQVLSAAMGGDPEAPWNPLGRGPDDDESPVARAAAAWNRLAGSRAAVAPELMVRCARELPRGLDPAAFLSALAACARHPAWNRDGDWGIVEGQLRRTGGGDDEVFSGELLLATARYVPFLFEALPVGDPLRGALADAVRRSRERLAHRGLLLGVASFYVATDKPAERQAILDAVGPDPFPPGGDRDSGRDGGLLVTWAGRWSIEVALRPAQLVGRPDRPAPLVEGQPMLAAARLMLGEPYERLVRRIGETPVPAGAFEANPLLSVPRLVEEVAAAKGLEQDAAVAWLQTLALRAPTAKALQQWNGWTVARYRKAMAQLAEKGLVLEAKRARAGRDHFLPGGWEELKAPELPLEAWKLPLYGARRDEAGLHRPLGVLLPLRPTHELFEAAWARVKGGDEPRYEEVR